jgi:hypothetical protein
MKPFSRDISTTVTPHTSDDVEVKWAANLAIDTSWTWAATPAAVTAVTGKVGVNTVTFPAKADATEGDFVHFEDTNGDGWLIALDKDGSGVANAGPVFAGVTAAHRAVVDISAATDAASVATAIKTALPISFDAAFTSVDNLDGTLTLTAVERGPLAVAFAPYNAAEDNVGSITSASDVVGVASKFDVGLNTISAANHGLSTGHVVRLTISGGGTLPDPFLGGTDYFVIRVDDSTFKLATSRVLADAGTAVNITDQGTADKTVTATVQANAGSLTLEYCSDLELDTSSVWRTLAVVDVDNETSPNQYRLTSNYYHFIRCTLALPSGFLSAFKCEAFGKGI